MLFIDQQGVTTREAKTGLTGLKCTGNQLPFLWPL